MSEFSVNLAGLSNQRNNLDNVAAMLKQYQKMVDNVNSGLGNIGIAPVAGALDAIEAKLAVHQKRCEALSDALYQIIRRFQLAESNITGVRTIGQRIEELYVNAGYEEMEEPTYVGVVYLLNSSGAVTQGHAAVALLLSDGSYEYYSYGSDLGLGYVWDNITDFDDVSESGSLDIDPEGDGYTHYVFIPVSDAQGDAMHAAAQELYANPGDYALFSNNCNMNAQMILGAGGVSFAPSEFDMVATRPNTVYENFLNLVSENPDDYVGYQFGNIDDDNLANWLESSSGAQQFISSDYNYSVAHTDTVEFQDPSGWFADGLETVFGGTSFSDIGSYWSEGWDSGIQDGVNFTIDHIQNTADSGVQWLQDNSNSAIDSFQENHISGMFSGLANGAIDGMQWVGNGIVDGIQWAGNGISDGMQWVGNGVVDGLEWVGNGIADGFDWVTDGVEDIWDFVF